MLTPEAIERANIQVAPVETRAVGSQVRVPGTIQPNGYKEVVVKALVAGRITRVAAELGRQVRRGTVLAELYSPELAQAIQETRREEGLGITKPLPLAGTRS